MITNPTDGKFELLALPYAEDALAPVISAETIRFHHGKHLQAYVNNLNAALPGSPFENLPLEEVVVKSEGGMSTFYFLTCSRVIIKYTASRQSTNIIGISHHTLQIRLFKYLSDRKSRTADPTDGLYADTWCVVCHAPSAVPHA